MTSNTSHKCPDHNLAIGSAPQYCGPEPFIQAVYAGQPCGCQIIGNGTLPHPLDIKRCAKHDAAPEMLAELRECAAALDALIEDRPMLAAKLCGSTTLGNRRAEARGVLTKIGGPR